MRNFSVTIHAAVVGVAVMFAATAGAEKEGSTTQTMVLEPMHTDPATSAPQSVPVVEPVKTLDMAPEVTATPDEPTTKPARVRKTPKPRQTAAPFSEL